MTGLVAFTVKPCLPHLNVLRLSVLELGSYTDRQMDRQTDTYTVRGKCLCSINMGR